MVAAPVAQRVLRGVIRVETAAARAGITAVGDVV